MKNRITLITGGTNEIVKSEDASPQKGDMLIFTTNFRPVKGTKGYYLVNMKHGVRELHSGERYTLGIIFHDALS